MENIYYSPFIMDPSDLELLITGHQLHANTNTNTNTNTNSSTSTTTSTITNMNRSASASVSTSTSTFRAGSNNNSNNSNNNNNNNSSSSYSEINNNDVLCGRGGLTNAHVGNHRFRRILAEYHQEYLHAPKNNKKAIAQKIVDRIEKLGGRFIHQNTGDTVWTRVTPQRALEKTSQALREGLDVKHRKVKKPVISARAGGGENRNKRKHKLVKGTVDESANAVSAATSTAVAVADNTHSGGRGNEARATARARATLGRNKKQHKVVVTGTAGVSPSPKSPKAVSVATSVADNDDISLDQCMAVFEVEVAFFNLIHRTTETVQQHGDTGSTSTGTGTGTSTGATTTRLIGTEIESCENVHEI